MHPSVDYLLTLFTIPSGQSRRTAKAFRTLAEEVARVMSHDSPATVFALLKLLETRTTALRAASGLRV